ncbi:MAG: DNA cytosine methyltransferase [Humibacillus sp.]|nr:DNA cytosine methyltransferase [Humibacillus sp.]MDN5777114.1 DNA cytosine methyltransferase [Humibacillus sp.]
MTATVVDLFSGGGGASAGFAANDQFRIVGAADAQIGKPSSGEGTLACNSTYSTNMGLEPVEANLGLIAPGELGERMALSSPPEVLIACPPCTGFSRTNAQNHVVDDHRNGLVSRVADYVAEWRPQVMVMENARELVMGKFKGHLAELTARLNSLGYSVSAETKFLNEFGLPQRRERALVIATAKGLPDRSMSDLWRGLRIDPKATHVRRAIWHLPELANGQRSAEDPMHVAPRIVKEQALARTEAIPHDGGSWFDLTDHPDRELLLTPTMKYRLAIGALGSHPDVYGRMWWDRPSPTIKRECGHMGNGRYTHPEQDRLCSVRELGILNGFPSDYTFAGNLSNSYRHIGDAVPPLISYQLARLAAWILGGDRPTPEELVMPGTHVVANDILQE